MQAEEIQGKVEATSEKPEESYYGIKVGGEWFNGENSLPDGIGEGDTVKLAVDRSDQFIDIMGIKKIQGEEDRSGEQVRSSSGGSPPSPTSLTKDQQITLKVAHKSAVQQLDRRSAETDEDYEEMLTKLTKLHLQSLHEVEEWMQE